MKTTSESKREYEAPMILSGESYERLALACTGTGSTRTGTITQSCTKAENNGPGNDTCDLGCVGS